ncbi:MAG: threonine synthase [Deltaproteobacteria bacterium]|nr:threonine synthase [Deltaproteobacteria bacterium]
MGYVQGLKCRECGREYPKDPINICEFCFGPLEVVYQYDEIADVLSREKIMARPPDMWRYLELLPLDEAPTVGENVGYTPLVRAENLAHKLGVSELYIKNDAVSFPTLSFKDRVVAVAVSKAKEFGFDTIACASTGNLANAVAACASSAGLKSYVFIPADLEQGKIMGTQVFGTNLVGVEGNYDDVNRLCTEVADQHRWAFVNINLRPFYAEGSKTFGYEIAEQLGWRLPQNVVVPMAGGSLITKLKKSFQEMAKIGLVEESPTKMFGAQATGCSPIVTAVKKGTELFKPVKPDTIAKSLAIGNPADGFYAIRTMTDSGGWGEEVTDDEIIEAIKLLAETEGIFTETAGGVTLGAAKKLIEQGKIPRDESIVVSITGNGLKTQEALVGRLHPHPVIDSRLDSFEALLLENQSRL